MKGLFALLVAGALLATASLGSGAVVAGKYSGTSKAKVIWRYGQLKPETDTGKVTFRVAANRITAFKIKGQRAQCPGTSGAPIVNVSVPSMRLSRAGVATAQVINPTFGPIKVSVRVKSKGKATGSVKYTLCKTTARFAAKR